MNRFLARLLLLCPSFFAPGAWAQAPAARVEETAARSMASPAAVTPAPQQLFGSIKLSTRSEEARKLVELAWDKYENAIYYDAVEIARRATQKDSQSPLAFAMTSLAARFTTPDHATHDKSIGC